MSIRVEISNSEDKTILKFEGAIDEKVEFPDSTEFRDNVTIDLEKICSINSIGIREWIRWFSTFEVKNLVLLKVPKTLVMQGNMVAGFLPSHAVIDSFQVPYYCESCDQEFVPYFRVGHEVEVHGEDVVIKFDASSLCCGSDDVELDINKKNYFRFLTKVKKAA